MVSPEARMSTSEISLGETRESEAKYRGLLEAAPDAMVVVDELGKIILLNFQTEKQFGYHRDELVGQPVKNIIPDGFAERLLADRLRSTSDALKQQIGTGIELTGRRKDGSEFPIEIMLSPLESPEGILVTAAIRNITVRKAAERHLAQMESRYRGLLEAAPDAMVVVNPAGNIVLLNVQAEKRFGYRRDELVGQAVTNIIPVGFAERLVADALRSEAEALAQQIGTGIELTGRRKDGSEFPIEIMLSPLESAEGILVTAAIRDVTTRTKAERRLKESEEEYRLLFDSNPHAMWVYDAETLAFLAVNDAAVRLYGYSREEFLVRKITDLRPVEEVPAQLEQLKTIPDSLRLMAEDVKHKKKDGTLLDVEGASNPIDFHGRRARLVLANDVSEKRQMEAQLQQAQKMDAMGRLAGGIAHDFNNLLMIIQSYGDVLESHLGDEKAIRRDISEIRGATERGAKMTQQLLALSRKQIVQPETLDPGEIVTVLHRMLSRLIREDIHFEIRIVPGSAFVRIDRGQLEQVVVNLVVNARDAMPAGGRLTVNIRRVDLDRAFAASHAGLVPGPFVQITVTDTGTGIDAATKSRIFEPFFTTKGVGKGTGLGLATVYGIVKGCGGDVSVYSEPGHGSAFKIYLPRVEAPAVAAAVAVPSPTVISRGNETLLILEDEVVIRDMLGEYLGALGYRLLQAGNGDDALRIARAHAGPIHLLLTDVVVPGRSGRVVAETLHSENPLVKVIFMSGYTDDAAIVRDVVAREADFLQKPFRLEVLALKIREVLDRAA